MQSIINGKNPGKLFFPMLDTINIIEADKWLTEYYPQISNIPKQQLVIFEMKGYKTLKLVFDIILN